MNASVYAAGALALLLSGTAVLELKAGVLGPPAAAAVDIAFKPPEPSPSLALQPHQDAGRVDALLARPLFSPGRRPSSPPASAAVQAEPLPRLAGTLVGLFGRRAVFAGAGKPVSVGEGDRLGAWTVRAIAAGSVTLAGPEGRRELRVVPAAGVPARLEASENAGGVPFWSNPCSRRHRKRLGSGAATSDMEECRAALAALAPVAVPPDP